MRDADPPRGSKEPDRGAGTPLAGIDERARAAVNAGAIVSFVAGLDVQAKSDVLLSTQLAQRAATKRFDRQTQTAAWYGQYIEVLEYCGWVGEGFAFTQRSSASGELRMDRSALDILAAVASGAQLAILVRTLDTLKGLAGKDGAIRLFEHHALRERSGNFQIGAAGRADNGAVALALGGFHFTSADDRAGGLFFHWGRDQIAFWAAATRMTLNADAHARVRRAIQAKLAADANLYIEALEL